MIFIDGTNLFYRLRTEKLKLVKPLREILPSYTRSHQPQRILLYTVRQHLEDAVRIHGSEMIHPGVRIVEGDGILLSDGNVKEKGVDALLVADLVYHAAVRNLDYALLVSTDTDFRHAIRRVEDFGCRTGVMSVCAPIPDRLREACDDPITLSKHDMLNLHLAVEL
jgi:uncharacterized LabA/DUF88 family protein